MRVIATAGHVDHGKSTLVRALTGMDPDRLREEQQREMTIDLGFAWMTLPNGEPVGIVDVPGHIDFIENMLAGVGGIDATLLVIAADEGAMPQTLEHLAILDLLRVQRGVVALTKTDLALDDEWIELIGADVRQLLAATPLADAAIVPVSARSRRGLDELLSALTNALNDAPARQDLGRPRLPVDRVFTLPGFGVVVTGTLADGVFALGDEVEVLTPRAETLRARIRGLQTHKRKLERAQPGSRVAINLSGVDMGQLARGSVVAKPNTLSLTTLVDARLEMIPVHAPHASQNPATTRRGLEGRGNYALRHNAEVKIFSGAAQSIARVWLLDGDALVPGTSGWAQLQLASPLALANGDRFILRSPSPSITIGGGAVVDAHPHLRYRRRGGHADEQVLKRLEALSGGSPSDRLTNALHELKFANAAQAAAKAQLDRAAIEPAVADLSARGLLIVAQDVLGHRDAWRDTYLRAMEILKAFHQAQPLAEGLPRDTLRSRLKLPVDVFNALLKLAVEQGGELSKLYVDVRGEDGLADEGDTVRMSSHQVQFNPAQQQAVDALLTQCRVQPWNTPLVKDARAVVSDDVYEAMLRRRMLVQISADVMLLPETYDQAVAGVRAFIEREGQITAAQARDLFGTTRKYALALMEHLDAIGVTKRVGDARVLK